MKKYLYAIFCFFLFSCQSQSSLNCEMRLRKNLENLMRSFEEIQSKEDFKHNQQAIKKEFDLLAKNLMSIRKDNLSGQKHHQVIPIELREKFDQEFERVMRIEGCKELYELVTLDALYSLDAFEQKLQFPSLKHSRLKKFEED